LFDLGTSVGTAIVMLFLTTCGGFAFATFALLLFLDGHTLLA
jgi:hypothetical protein